MTNGNIVTKMTLPVSVQDVAFLRDCRNHYGVYSESYMKNFRESYLLPGSFDVLGYFNERSGDLECYSMRQVFYPSEEANCRDAREANAGVMFFRKEPSYNDCVKGVNHMTERVTNTKTNYYAVAVLEGKAGLARMCFKVEIRYLRMARECPTEYKGYHVDVRSFKFRIGTDTRIRGKLFYRSPSVAQYEYLRNSHFSLVNDDYDYDSHENEYDLVLDKNAMLSL